MRHAWLLGLLIATGCGQGQGIVEVTVTTRLGETLHDVEQFHVLVIATVGGQQRTSMTAVVFSEDSTLPPAQTFALRFSANVAGGAVLRLAAVGSAGNELALADVPVTITPSESHRVTILLPGDGVVLPDLAMDHPDLATGGGHTVVCGDGICEGAENCANCKKDCAPASTTENSVASCTDQCDNDSNGFTDCEDFNCCPFVTCAPSTSCGKRQACASAGTSCANNSCPAGTTCVFRLCDGVLECQFPSTHCTTVAGVACPKVSTYDICTQTADCAAGASCQTRGGTTTRCWPDSMATGATCPDNFCPGASSSFPGVTRACQVSCRAGTSECSSACELACTTGATCPFGLQCLSNFCSDG